MTHGSPCMIDDAKRQGSSGLVLTCKNMLVNYYAKFGFVNEGGSDSQAWRGRMESDAVGFGIQCGYIRSTCRGKHEFVPMQGEIALR